MRLARMPEKHKATLKDTLSEEIAAVLEQRPDLTLVKLADGAKDNWATSVRSSPKASRSSISIMPVTI